MNPLRALEDTLETHHRYKTADRLRALVKALTTRTAEINQKTWLNRMWKVTHTLDDLFQRENYLNHSIHLLTETRQQLEATFEHLDVNNLPIPQTVTAAYAVSDAYSEAESNAAGSDDGLYATPLPTWNRVAQEQIDRMTQEREFVQRHIYLVEQERDGVFSEQPGGVWIREVVALVLRNQGRDFWEQGRRECIRVGGCCTKDCRCCVGWLLHCAGSCACCDRFKDRVKAMA